MFVSKRFWWYNCSFPFLAFHFWFLSAFFRSFCVSAGGSREPLFYWRLVCHELPQIKERETKDEERLFTFFTHALCSSCINIFAWYTMNHKWMTICSLIIIWSTSQGLCLQCYQCGTYVNRALFCHRSGDSKWLFNEPH